MKKGKRTRSFWKKFLAESCQCFMIVVVLRFGLVDWIIWPIFLVSVGILAWKRHSGKVRRRISRRHVTEFAVITVWLWSFCSSISKLREAAGDRR